MIEIKFRVWIDRYKQFKYWGFVEDGMFTGVPTGSGVTIEEAHELSQQFTGLLDKNGKEIYEGDLVECYPSGIVGTVIWEPDLALFQLEHNDPVHNNCTSSLYSKQEDGRNIRREVIGNIYEKN